MQRAECSVLHSSHTGLSLSLQLSMPAWTSQVYGGCAQYWLHVTSLSDDSQLFVDVVCINKTATRLPEVLVNRGFHFFWWSLKTPILV